MYKLRTVAPGLSIQPPSATTRSSISIGDPGAQIICSTGLFWSSQVLALIFISSPSASTPTTIGKMRALTLDPGQCSRVGR
jgi:hypothetical protein